MNRKNLLKAANYLETIPQELFDMYAWRTGDRQVNKCDSVGCAIGHTVHLDRKAKPRFPNGGIVFHVWSQTFYGFSHYGNKWNWCFSSKWKKVDNTSTGVVKRIHLLLEQGLPENWKEQINGTEPLSY